MPLMTFPTLNTSKEVKPVERREPLENRSNKHHHWSPSFSIRTTAFLVQSSLGGLFMEIKFFNAIEEKFK